MYLSILQEASSKNNRTIGVKQLLARYPDATRYANADDILTTDRTWLLEQWQKASLSGKNTLLVIDEIQKVQNWSETVKSLWDKAPKALRVILLGSSSLQLQKGLSESLSGRFELIKTHQWTYEELKRAFKYDLDRYLTYGGYPGAVVFESDFDRWYAYLKESNTTEDIMLAEFVQDLVAQGLSCFSFDDVKKLKDSSPAAIKGAIRRLQKKEGDVAMPYRGFYVFVPPEYRAAGCRPLEQFIPGLMAHVGKDYYAGLLSAA